MEDLQKRRTYAMTALNDARTQGPVQQFGGLYVECTVDQRARVQRPIVAQILDDQ
jgi:hypothetical protein